MLATTLLLFAFLPSSHPQNTVTDKPAAASEVAKDSPESRTLPSAPEPKADAVTKDTPAPNAASPGSTPVFSASNVMAAAGAIAAPAAAGPAPVLKTPVEKPYETSRQKKIWYGLAAASHGAAAFDAWSTRRALSGNYGRESNPMLRPFAHSGSLYAVTQLSPALMDFLGRRMMVSRHALVRKLWWVPQTAGMGVSLRAGANNVGVVP